MSWPSVFISSSEWIISSKRFRSGPTWTSITGALQTTSREIKRAKKAISIPVIAGINGVGLGNWARHAVLLEDAGADAVELNAYFVPTDPEATAAQVEKRYLDLVAAVREAVTIPLAVKLGPYFTSLPNFARRLVEVGANGLVLFNRFVQPDIALETLEITPRLALSTSAELRLPLRWIAILRPQLAISLAASTGIQTSEDVIKLLLVGADVTMTTSALLRHGPALPPHLTRRVARLAGGTRL